MFSNTNVHEGCDWVANVADDDPTGNEDAVELLDHTYYEIKIDNIYNYHYFDCEGFDPNTEGFFCPNGAQAREKDLYFTYTPGTGSLAPNMDVEIVFDAIPPGPFGQNISNYFSTDDWIMPYNLDVVCDFDPACILNGALEVGIFLSPQSGPMYNHVDENMTIYSGQYCYWNDIELNFSPTKRLIVFGDLDADNVTFGGNPTWNGPAFSVGSNVVVSNSIFDDTTEEFFIDNATVEIGPNTTITQEFDRFNLKSGSDLTIKEGTTIRMGPGVGVSFNGNVDVLGTASNPVRFEGTSPTQYWGGGILFGISADNAQFKYVDINDPFTALYFFNVDNLELEDVDITVNSFMTLKTGILLTGSTGNTFDGVRVDGLGRGLMSISNSSVNLVNSVFKNNQWGVQLHDSSVDAGDYNIRGYTTIKNNNDIGLYTFDSDADLGSVPRGGYNSIFNNSGLDISAHNSSVSAEQTYWGDPNGPIPGKIGNNNSKINTSQHLSSDPNAGSKTYSDLGTPFKATSMVEVAEDDFVVESARMTPLEFRSAVRKSRGENGRSASLEMLTVIASQRNHPHQDMAAAMRIQDLVNLEQYSEAISSGEQLLDQMPNDRLDAFSLAIDLFAAHHFGRNDPANAQRMLDRIAEIESQRTGAETAVLSVLPLLSPLIETSPADVSYNKQGHTSEMPTKSTYSLSNYPNPFTSSTSITYTLDEEAHISLMVYDEMGRRVSTLVNERQQPGAKTAQFDGSLLSGGIYFYRLSIGGATTTEKMLRLP